MHRAQGTYIAQDSTHRHRAIAKSMDSVEFAAGDACVDRVVDGEVGEDLDQDFGGEGH